jgi:hypothetical protein
MTNDKSLNRIALLYRDLLSNTIHSLNDTDKQLLTSIKPKNKIVAIGNISQDNWNAYPLTYLLYSKLVAPTVLNESQIYQSMHAMRVHDDNIIHPQMLISQSVVIRIVGLDNSANINDYINSFISMCIASDECRIVFIVFNCDKKYYKNNIYIRKSNSTFIETSSGKPYMIESTPLCILPDDIVFFNNQCKQLACKAKNNTTVQNSKKYSCMSMLNDNEIF